MKVLIVVPVYNCAPVIDSVLKSLLEKTKLNILVVDDGSDNPIKGPDDFRIKVLRNGKNEGKGFSLIRAMKWAQENYYTHILTIDGDGQHRAEDVPKLLEVSEKKPDDMVVGVREFDESVPGVSQFGRKFSNFWVRYQTGQKVADSQSGLRIYPLEKLASLDYFSKRYDFEIEIMVRGIWRGLGVQEVSVGVIYPPREERISHFDKLWDNARITGLNIFLIAYSLIFFQRSLPKTIAVGFVGYAASLVPTFIPATLIGLFLCVVFRLNVPLFIGCLLVLRFI